MQDAEVAVVTSATCLHQLRHGGASRDALLDRWSADMIQKRGRWAARVFSCVTKSMGVYRKQSMMPRLLVSFIATAATRRIFFKSATCSVGLIGLLSHEVDARANNVFGVGSVATL